MMVRSGTKFFKKRNALKAQKILRDKGIQTKIVKTTKINPLSEKRNFAYLIKRI